MTTPSDIHMHTAHHSYAGASLCPSCSAIGEFDLPTNEGHFEIACHSCDHIYEISAHDAVEQALSRGSNLDEASTHQPDNNSPTVFHCMDCGTEINITGLDPTSDDFDPACPNCQAIEDDDNLLSSTRFAGQKQAQPKTKTSNRTGIILVSILSLGLAISAVAIAIGLYFLTLRSDSDVSRYIETNVLQLAPASFAVRTATYEVSETDAGTSLLVTIAITNTGQVEGTPEDMKIALTDAQNNPLVTWPLDASGQIIAPGATAQLYTRLFEPPENFANLRVFMR